MSYLEEYEEGIKKELNDFKAFLKGFRPEHKLTHSIGNKNEIESLKKVITDLSESISLIEIPKKVKMERIVTYDIKNRTRRFLVFFSCFSSLILASGIYIGSRGITIENRVIEKNNEVFLEGKKEGRTEIYNALPPSSQKYLKKKFPDKKKTFWSR